MGFWELINFSAKGSGTHQILREKNRIIDFSQWAKDSYALKI